MKCPKCDNSKLLAKKVKGKNILLDLCPSCKGMWFDKDELSLILGVPKKNIDIPENCNPQDIKCPRCDQPLFIVCYPKTITLIDLCNQCKGIWLDAEEFQQIKTVRSKLNGGAQTNSKQNVPLIKCPKCDHEQAEASECIKCGIIFSKYEDADKKMNVKVEAPKTSKQNYSSSRDAIPGMKGTLLSFINNSIERLTTY